MIAGGIRLVSGVSFLVAPKAASRLWGSDPDDNPTASLLLRSMGYRDALVGAMLLRSGRRGDAQTAGWFLASAGADLADLVGGVANHDRLPARWQGRRGWHGVLARLGFVSIALLIYWATWTSLWQSMTALIIGIAVLLGLPILVRQDLPVLGRALRRYDAKEYATLFRRYRENPAARAAITLVAYLAVLTVLGWSRNALDPNPHLVREIPLNILVVATSLVAFQLLVAFSRRHMAQFPPTLAMAPSKPVATTAATG